MTDSTGNLYLDMARRARGVVARLLNERGLQPPARWIYTERDQYRWLIGVLPQGLPKLTPYVDGDVTHSLQTALGGRPVIISNTTGLRYAILLSERPKLPDSVTMPDDRPEKDVFRLGMGLRGPVEAHAKDWMHLLLGGAPGSGKSSFLRGLAHTARAHGWGLYLCDPDGNTFPEVWSALAAAPVASRAEELANLIGLLEGEIARRVALFGDASRGRGGLPPENIDQYNELPGIPPLPRAALIVDEANGYLGDKKIEKGLAELARRGRKWGLHLVLAAHSWRAEDISRALSAMLVTRACFRVRDDTSGKVTLGSQRWGTYAMNISDQQPGRAVLALGGRIQPVQTYHLSTQQEQKWLLNSASLPEPLSEKERLMVQVALEQFEGQFPVNKLAKEENLKAVATEWEIRKTAEAWEACGWLTKPANATDSRRVTPELAKLAGVSS